MGKRIKLFVRSHCADMVSLAALMALAGSVVAGAVPSPAEVKQQTNLVKKSRTSIAMVQPGLLWIDAEDFSAYGGWWLDTQFVHLMGSGYLIAAGTGTPVDDAHTAFENPTAGTFRIWVRCRNWIKDHAPGRFGLVVNGTPLEHVFGAADSDEWIWEDGGSVELAKGRNELRLHDLTGYYGRCDAIVLSADPAYRLPNGKEGLRTERARLTGLSLDPVDEGVYDVVVVGGGPSGGVAALAAARQGMKTALIQDRPVLGGNASIELGVPVQGAAFVKGYAREGGICEELNRLHAVHHYGQWSGPLELATAAETNLTVFLNQRVHGVDMTNSAIRGVCAVDTLSGMESCFKGSVFIDCTGDGWLGYYAGADFHFGREARSEYGESLAPDEADERTMSGCLMGKAFGFGWKDAGEPVPYEAPEWAPRFPENPSFGRSVANMQGQWWLEHSNSIDDMWNGEQARDELIRISFGYWDWLKNRWEKKSQARNARLTMIPIMSGRRESRRLMGDYVLTQTDCEAGRIFDDAIGHYGWMLDIHHPEGIYSGEAGPYDFDEHIPLGSIPYRSLYSRNVPNLLMAGRCISVSHVALGTVRVEGQCAVTGQAAGTAAALAVRYRTTPRGVHENHLRELQQTLLRDDQYIPGLRNEDPADLARTATASATSFAPCDMMDAAAYAVDPTGRDMPMHIPHWFYFQNGEQKHVGSLYINLYSMLEQPTEMKLLLLEAQHPWDEESVLHPRKVGEATATIDALSNGYVEFKFDVPVETPWFAVYCEPKGAKGVYATAAVRGFPGSVNFWQGEGGLVKGEKPRLMVYTEPALRLERDYAPRQAINGASRHGGTEANMWRSDPSKPLPQSLELKWDKPQTFNRVQLTFDTNLDSWRITEPLDPATASDYSVEVFDGAEWRTVVDEKGNVQRHRIHRFPAVKADRMRLVVHKTHGDPSARVYEVRVYNQ